MRCEERDKLLELLLMAIKAHNEAVNAMIGRGGEAREHARQLAANAEKTYEDCHEVLEAHERSHGCGIESVETSTAIKEKRWRGFKPSKGTQQSFHLSRSFDAASNAQAVRKFMGWMQHRRGLGRLGLAQEGSF
jgi:hypothetical protein